MKLRWLLTHGFIGGLLWLLIVTWGTPPAEVPAVILEYLSLIVGASTIAVAGLISWNGIEMYAPESFPELPSVLYTASWQGAIVVMPHHLSYLWWWPPNPALQFVPAAIVGTISWFVGGFICSLITASIRGIDLSDHQRTQTADPYGDKHAQRILNENSES